MNSKHLAAYRTAQAAKATAEGKRRAQADKVARAEAVLADIEAKAVAAAAEAECAGVDEAARLARHAQDLEAAVTAARRLLRNERDALAHAVAEDNAAQQRVTDARMQLRKDHLDQTLVARMHEIRTEERSIAFMISAGRLRGIATTGGDGALDGPPARPTSAVTLPSPTMVVDINSPLGSPVELAAAHEYWQRFDAELDTAIAANEERAA